MSLRTKIKGLTAWVNLRLTPYDQLLNNVLMDLLSGTHMKYFIESFTGREIKKLENMDGLSQQQKQTRVDWVMDELKKCDVLPEDVFVDARLFAMRSADHVFDLLWRLISHDIWFLWERAEYLQHHDMDVLTQVPFKWTPDPPPKKKKSKKAAKKSLLSGFGASASGADEKQDDDTESQLTTEEEEDSRQFGSKIAQQFSTPVHSSMSRPLDSQLSMYSDHTHSRLTVESQPSVDVLSPWSADSSKSEKMSVQRNIVERQTTIPGQPLESGLSQSVPHLDSTVSIYSVPLESRLSAYMFQPPGSSLMRSCTMTPHPPVLVLPDKNKNSVSSHRKLNFETQKSADKFDETKKLYKKTVNCLYKHAIFLLVNNFNYCNNNSCEFCKSYNLRETDRSDRTVSEETDISEVTDSDGSEREETVSVITEVEIADISTADAEIAEIERANLTDNDTFQLMTDTSPSDPADPIQDDLEETWIKFPNAEYMKNFKKKKRDKCDYPSPEECVLELINYQLKSTRDGKNLFCYSIDDFVDSRVLCALVNSFVPNTFTPDLLLNDRWTINMALKTAEKMFYAETPFDSEDLVEADSMAVCSYFAFFLMVAYRFRQTQAVINRVDFFNMLIRECNHELEKLPPVISNMQQLQRRKELKQDLDKHRQALETMKKRFDIDFCRRWIQHVEHVQNELRREIREKMRLRFTIVEIPRNITINDFCLAAVINLSLTNGSGFYLSSSRETLSEGRRLVLRHKETGEFIEDFTNKSSATVRQTLGLQEVTNTVVEINPSDYPDYDFFFEAQSRNKQLKTGTQFLYQVFPGNTTTWQRLFIRSARDADYETVEKMITFFKEHPMFINSREPKTGNTALHWACRNGHFEVVRLLLENGANIDLKNNFRCTPINLAVEGLQRKICHYLIEWGCDVHQKNIKGQSLFETIKNDEFKRYLIDLYEHYSSIVPMIMSGDMSLLDDVIKDHSVGRQEFCCLRSRCINGSTLLHTACYYGHLSAIQELLSLRVDINLRDYKGATPLHRAKNPDVMEVLLDAGAQVNAEDSEGNSPLHVKCYGETNMASDLLCIEMLLNRNASLVIRNSRGLLPIHCCAMQGRIDVMELMMKFDQNDAIATFLNKEDAKKPPSLLHLAIANDFTDCAFWLLANNFHFKEREQDILLRRILTEQIKLTKRGEAVKFLLENGAEANPKYPGGNTALHYAAGLSGPTDALELLLNSGAEVDAVNEEGCTPLFFATQSNSQFAACVLIEQGANVRQRNNQGLTAFDQIVDFEEWIDCGYFSEDIRARLKAYNLKHARDLIRAISKKVKPGPLHMRQELSKSAFALRAGSTMMSLGGSAGAPRHRILPPLQPSDSSGYLMFS